MCNLGLSALIHKHYIFRRLHTKIYRRGNLVTYSTITLSTLLLSAKRHLKLKPHTTVYSRENCSAAYCSLRSCDHSSYLLRDRSVLVNNSAVCCQKPSVVCNARSACCRNDIFHCKCLFKNISEKTWSVYQVSFPWEGLPAPMH